MEKCVHVSKIRPAWDHSILNPEKWLCYICKTTESVWACLSCSNVACGRFNEKHALKHYQESKHPISIEVNEKYVYCYVCDDYVLNDNAAGDIRLLRSALGAIATQQFTDIESRGRRLLRSYSHTGVSQGESADDVDKVATADWHHRQRLLSKVFTAWRNIVQEQKKAESPIDEEHLIPIIPASSLTFKKRYLTPGVTGLRNLGNTCYMNSVLQILSHIEIFRDFFLLLKYDADDNADRSSPVRKEPSPSQEVSPSSKQYTRQTTVDCFQHLMYSSISTKKTSPQKKPAGGLNGGSAHSSSPVRLQLICDVESQGNKEGNITLCEELHGLFRVLWSGKWAQVSPHAFLRAVWQAILMFKGYAQHDAQEFLCELLDKIQTELDGMPRSIDQTNLLTNLFQGQLVSMVTCLSCGNVSKREEPYTDLSLEFPNRYQITKQNSRVAEDICHITEMLAKFTEEEHLEGKIYCCEKCNKNRFKSTSPMYTEAKKQLLISKLPDVLRLHLKRFRWSGRMHREKISTHVAADEVLDLKPFCYNSEVGLPQYKLFGVIIHHGRGFGSGHYTAYTWNSVADSWVSCNDSRMLLSSLQEVLSSQAYILFYKALQKRPVHRVRSCQRSQTSTAMGSDSHTSKDTIDMPDHSSIQCSSSLSSLSSLSSASGLMKLDGTEVMPYEDISDVVIIENSSSSVQVVDNEVSFNFKLPLAVDSQDDSRHVTRPLVSGSSSESSKGAKRPIDTSETVPSIQCSKRTKQHTFESDMFYSKGILPENRKSFVKNEHITKSDLNNSLCKFNEYLQDKEANDMSTDNPKHIKRRKSAFW